MAKTTTTAEEQVRKSARERLLDTANRLFYSEGVQTVGIDRIIEESGVAKASLYNAFGSKDALIEAYLHRRHEGTTGRLTAAIGSVDDPREKILAVFDAQAKSFAAKDFHGCAFMGASAEAREGGVIDQATAEFRGWIRAMFLDLARGVGAADPERLARQLHVLYDGGTVTARMDHDKAIAADTRAAVAALVDLAVA